MSAYCSKADVPRAGSQGPLSCLAHSLKMFQRQGQMDKQPGGVPFVEDLATKLMNNDLACELAAESFSIRITVDRWPTLLLPRHEKLILGQSTIDMKHAGSSRQSSVFQLVASS